VIARLHPGIEIGQAQVPALAEHNTRFSLAGLRAIGEASRAKEAPPSRGRASRHKPASRPLSHAHHHAKGRGRRA
jgi:hypothetical protein